MFFRRDSRPQSVKKLCVVVSTTVILSLLGGCGLSKKEEKISNTGESLYGIRLQLAGDLLGIEFWEGGFEVFAVGLNDNDEIVPFADGTQRAQANLKHRIIDGTPRKAIGLLSFDLPAKATKWRLEADSIVGRVCQFSPSSGSVSDVPTQNPTSEESESVKTNTPAGLYLQDSNFTVTASCSPAHKVSGTVDMPVEGLVVTMNGHEFVVNAEGDPAVFSYLFDKELTHTVPTTGGNIIIGNAEAFWSKASLRASDPMVAEFTISAKMPNGKACSVTPSANRFEESVTMKAGEDGTVDPIPSYVKIFNRLKNVKIGCKAEPTLTLGGTVTDLHGSIVLKTATGDSLTITTTEKETKEFTFPAKIVADEPFEVSIETQPDHQTCSITSGGSGTATADITDIAITCTYKNYTVGGTVASLEGAQVKLKLVGEDEVITIDSNGAFTFTSTIPFGGSYQVLVDEQPSASELCEVANGSGTINAGSVSNVTVNCINQYVLSVNVTGITGNGSVTVRDVFSPGAPTGDRITTSVDGTFPLAGRRGEGHNYQFDAYPTDPGVECDIEDDIGVMMSDVTVNVTCI